MKKAFLLIACLCLLFSAAFAEEAVELNWTDFGAQEAQGEFHRLELPGAPAVSYWVPSGLNPVDTGMIEGPFKPTALYAAEDQQHSLAVFVQEAAGLEAYASLMESVGGGSNFRNVAINGVGCIGYEVRDADMACMLYPAAENTVLCFSCTPLHGDDDWNGAKDMILASIQPAP